MLIRNYPIISKIDDALPIKKNNDKLTFIYVGGLTRIRGIKEVCESVKEFPNELQLFLVGNWESEVYQNTCLSVGKNIEYLGLKPLGEVYSIMKTADVGIATLYPEKNYLNSLPIKAFEYMACGLPIIMSNFPYWIKEFKNNSLFVNPNKIEEIKKAIVWLKNNKDERLKMGQTGKKEVKEKYSWEAEAKTLIKMYDELSGK